MVNGWKTKKLGEVAEVCMCKRIFAHQTSKIGDIPFYKIGTFGKEADAYISSQLYEEYKAKYSYPEKGDVLISAAGTLGRTVVFDGRPAYFQDSNIVWLKIDKSQLSNDYLAQYYKVIKWASSEGSTISRLYNGIICDTEILLPPLEEQAAIAKALSDVDSLTSSLQKLIEKKKAIKQGAMQELLTGQKRLPGFSGEWSKQQLGDICNIVNGGTPSTSIAEFWNGKILWCTPTDITSCSTKYIYTTESKITESGLKASSATLLPKGALLLCSRATIGEVRIAGNTICTNQGFKSLVVHQNISNEWLYYMVHVLKFNMLEKAIGSTFLEISKKDLAELDIIVPEFTEQKAIAQVLSDMDSEIELLEKKLAKYQQIKQGMMQELLSGRIRLKEGENNG